MPSQLTEVADLSTLLTAGPVVDSRRGRSFYKYIQPKRIHPPESGGPSEAVDRFDSVINVTDALKSYAQLAALRCGAPKALINFMDRDVMYSLAEASLSVPGTGADVLDDIFRECSSVPLEGRICELTLRVNAVEAGNHYPLFVIQDLSQDPRFSHMGIVRGEPGYRFYAGVPLTTRDGVNIGSLAVMDVKVRAGLNDDEEQCLGETAARIMSMLEINRTALEGIRSRKMVLGLDRFIAGKRTLEDDSRLVYAQASPPLSHHPSHQSHSPGIYGIFSMINEESENPTEVTENASDNRRRRTGRNLESITVAEDASDQMAGSEDDTGAGSKHPKNGLSHTKIFSRAANLLRECLDLGENGGVLFVSVGTGLKTGKNTQQAEQIPSGPPSGSPSSRDQARPVNLPTSTPEFQEATILASSTSTTPFAEEGKISPELKAVANLDQEVVRELIKRYPEGHVWAFGDRGMLLSSSDDDYQEQQKPRTARVLGTKTGEVNLLQDAFPDVREIMFTPIFDAFISRHSIACFVFSMSDNRPLASNSELNFLKSFCNIVRSELSRVDALIAEQQKNDFVGTISHEMRSPLHGILASIEFLTETAMDGYQRSLLDTVDACGRTLLDTINHVLDFAKINSFERNWEATNKAGPRSRRRQQFHGLNIGTKALPPAPQISHLSALTDISVILEESVDGITSGQNYVSGLDITDVTHERRGSAATQVQMAIGRSGTKMNEMHDNPVDMILDIQQADWVFVTNPGSLRRVFMNTFGNAVKYTSQGSIHVRLSLENDDENDGDGKTMVLTITDTGKGISPQFMTSRLYVPFAQENPLAPGTGLGLSVVRSIVSMLGGNIDIESQVGKGTVVRIALPMTKLLPGSELTVNAPPAIIWASGNSVGGLRHEFPTSRVAIHGFDEEQKGQDPSSLSSVLARYVQDWYGFELVRPSENSPIDLVVVEQANVESALGLYSSSTEPNPSFIVIRNLVSKNAQAMIHKLEVRGHSVEMIAKPCGPSKLAKAFRTSLEKARTVNDKKLKTILEYPSMRTPASHANKTKNVVHRLGGVDLHGPDGNKTTTTVHGAEMSADPQNGGKASVVIGDPGASGESKSIYRDHFSFPMPRQETTKSYNEEKRRLSSHPRPAVNGSEGVGPLDLAMSIKTSDRMEGEEELPNLLLVDDNKINLRLLETFLKRRGYRSIALAEDGQQAVDAFRSTEKPYDIIFMDISMPVMDGFEATKAIRAIEAERDCKYGPLVVALTGLASSQDQAEAFHSGCDVFMIKPVKFKEVGALLENWKHHRSIHRRNRQGEAQVGGPEAALKSALAKYLQ